MSFSDSWGGGGGWMGSVIGQNLTKDDKKKIKGNIDQQLTDAQGLGGTAFDGISTDPKVRQAQMQALAQLQGLSGANGLDPQAQAMQAEANRESAGYEQSQRAALQQNLEARGMGGAGADVAGLLTAQQGGANRAAASGQEAASQARNRSLQAMSQGAQLAGAVRGQDYSEAANKANAQDDAKYKKYGAVRDARAGQTNYYAADRAETIGNMQAAGQGLGQMYGSGADVGASYATGGMSGKGGGGGASPLQSYANQGQGGGGRSANDGSGSSGMGSLDEDNGNVYNSWGSWG